VAALVVVLVVVGLLVSSHSKKGTVASSGTPTTASTVAVSTTAPALSTTAPAITARPAVSTTTTSPSTTSTSASMLLAPSGQPYEPGNLCRRDERGKTTTAGNGATITCELVNGSDVWVKG
jgi:hypothetical protein